MDFIINCTNQLERICLVKVGLDSFPADDNVIQYVCDQINNGDIPTTVTCEFPYASIFRTLSKDIRHRVKSSGNKFNIDLPIETQIIDVSKKPGILYYEIGSKERPPQKEDYQEIENILNTNQNELTIISHPFLFLRYNEALLME